MLPDTLSATEVKGMMGGQTPSIKTGGLPDIISADEVKQLGGKSIQTGGDSGQPKNFLQQQMSNMNNSFIGKLGNPFTNIINQVKGNVKEASDKYAGYLTNPNPSLGDALSTGANIAKNTTEAVLSPLNQTVGKLVEPILKPVINYAADKISNSPAVQKSASWYDKHPNLANTASDTLQTGLNMAQLGTMDSAPQEIANKTSELGTNLKDKIIGSPEDKFNTNLNKALPVLKNDVRNLPLKQENARTAFQDIVANKDKIGLIDKNGQPRVPENFTETVQANQARKSQIYQDYSNKLSTVDKAKFETDISNGIQDQVKSIDNQLAKENSLDGRRALTKIRTELSTLRDTSPEGMQKYVEDINQRIKTAPGAPLSTEQIKLANVGGEIRSLLDSSVEKTGQGYQDLRNTYGAHRAIESQLLAQAKKEMNNVPGLTDKLATAGATVEGINFLLTHNPQSLAVGLGLKGLAKWMAYVKSPTTALGKMFSQLEKESQIQPSSISPETTIQSANNVPSKSNIPQSTTEEPLNLPNIPDKNQTMEMGSYKLGKNKVNGNVELTGQYRKPGVSFYSKEPILSKANQISKDPLAQEAQKYKSAEMIKNANEIHGARTQQVLNDLGIKPDKEGYITLYRGDARANMSEMSGGTYLTNSKKVAGGYGGKVHEVKILPNEIIDAGDFNGGQSFNTIVPMKADAQGRFSSQLTDFYNKVKGGGVLSKSKQIKK
jgi:hypothetical protein